MMLPAFNILEDTKFFRSRFPVPASLGSHTKTNIFRMVGRDYMVLALLWLAKDAEDLSLTGCF